MNNFAIINKVVLDVEAHAKLFATAWNEAFNYDDGYQFYLATEEVKKILFYKSWMIQFEPRIVGIPQEVDAAIHAAISALSAYDCAYMLDEKLEDVLMLSKLGSVPATLMFPICLGYYMLKNSNKVKLHA